MKDPAHNAQRPASLPDKLSAQERLVLSRSHISHWLEQNRTASPGGAAQSETDSGLSSVLTGFIRHPGLALVLAALAKSWQRTSPPKPMASHELSPMDMALSELRRHPKTALAAMGLSALLVFWANRPARSQPAKPRNPDCP